MIPQGGFTLIFHAALLVVFAIGRKLRYVSKRGVRLPSSALMISPVLLIVMAGSAAALLSTAFANQPTYGLFLGAPEPCEEGVYKRPTGPVAVLRIDDIQAYAWRDIQIRMIDDALARDMPPVLGVVPIGLSNDHLLTTFLVNRRCSVEIALHGWDHGGSQQDSYEIEGEFAHLSKSEAIERIGWGLDALAPITNDVHTFIPPENDISEGGLAALPETGFTVLSAGSGRPDDFHATTFDYYNYHLTPPSELLSKCRDRFDKNSHCVIMLHPQDFADEKGNLDPEKYSRYLAVLDVLAREKVTVLRFSDLYDVR